MSNDEARNLKQGDKVIPNCGPHHCAVVFVDWLEDNGVTGVWVHCKLKDGTQLIYDPEEIVDAKGEGSVPYSI